MKESIPATTEESPQTERYARPTKNKRWIGRGAAGSMSGIISVSIAYLVLLSEPYCPSCSTGLDPSYVVIFCGQILFFGAFLGFLFGLIGGSFAALLEKIIDFHLNLDILFAFVAGAILGAPFFITGGLFN